MGKQVDAGIGALTLLAGAVAGEAGVPFFSASASGFIEMIVGDGGASRVRDRVVMVSPPDRGGHEAILEVHTREIPLAEDVNLAQVARTTSNRWPTSRAGRSPGGG